MPLLDLLAPPRCVACLARGRTPWCDRCLAQVRWLHDQSPCPRCAAPRDAHECWPAGSVVRSVVALARYEGPVASAVVAGKVRGAAAVWRVFGTWLGHVVHPGRTDVVTAVPTDRARARARGLDHAQLLAASVAGEAALPARRLLAPDGPLPDRGASNRGAGGRHGSPVAPGFVPRTRVDGARVLLVDDVLTTGTTVASAATALARAGAATIDVAVVARAGTTIELAQTCQPGSARIGGHLDDVPVR